MSFEWVMFDSELWLYAIEKAEIVDEIVDPDTLATVSIKGKAWQLLDESPLSCEPDVREALDEAEWYPVGRGRRYEVTLSRRTAGNMLVFFRDRWKEGQHFFERDASRDAILELWMAAFPEEWEWVQAKRREVLAEKVRRMGEGIGTPP